jgi:hypothetical protein
MKHTSNLSLIAGLLMLAASSAATAVAVSGQGTWETTLQARDINGDGKTDAYYDSSSNLTWLADANAVVTTGYTYPVPPGAPLDWFQNSAGLTDDAVYGWLQHLNSTGVTGWRLPSVQVTQVCDNSPHMNCWGEPVAGTSELEGLIKQTLGNTAGTLNNSGSFSNILNDTYWTSATVYAGPGKDTGVVFFNPVAQTYFTAVLAGSPHAQVWAVHTGDVQAVPEPATTGLMLLGGVMAVTVARRRTVKQPG